MIFSCQELTFELSSSIMEAIFSQAQLGSQLETNALMPSFRMDTRTSPPDVFKDLSQLDFSKLSWKDLGKPFEVKNLSKDRLAWEQEHQQTMPVLVQWQNFNKNFHEIFLKDLPAEQTRTSKQVLERLKTFDITHLPEELQEWLEVRVWNKVHRLEDAVWDPRGKCSLFEGLEVKRPRILFLGAAEGYEAMQLSAMYPGGEVILVDYDDFCRTDRFGKFPESYPFLGKNPATNTWDVYHREDFTVHYEVADIRNLTYGAEFDIVLSVGLLEHFPDSLKPEVVDWHRKFVKPGG